ncbi:hypothetical protein AOQ84DRAFT_417556 [Glonium stellatum]|uniref:SnoaL-like domain-containing protein n=1 Tax=Glonium stellatum TaxID=574774 RepID=A0A8E2JXA9_9PEZI|nr:hypothetical protein AOQ84DRAFT_417556 [Glonium stellatum]
MSATTTTVLTYPTSYTPTTRLQPSLTFLELYTAKVDSLDLSGPSTAYYSPNAIFYNTDGTVYSGGTAIWTWMRGLFGPFAALKHNILSIRLTQGVEVEGLGKGDLAVLETQTSFWLKGPDGARQEEPVVVPRLLSFLVGEAEDGLGTQGRWIVEGKVWWDTGVLMREVARRKGESETR